jgi:excisionase family DNA binding protein
MPDRPTRIEALPLTLTVEQSAEALGISRGSAYEGIRTGEIPHVRIGRRILVPRAMLAAFLGEPAAEAHNGHARPPQHSTEPDERDGGHAGAAA